MRYHFEKNIGNAMAGNSSFPLLVSDVAKHLMYSSDEDRQACDTCLERKVIGRRKQMDDQRRLYRHKKDVITLLLKKIISNSLFFQLLYSNRPGVISNTQYYLFNKSHTVFFNDIPSRFQSQNFTMARIIYLITLACKALSRRYSP